MWPFGGEDQRLGGLPGRQLADVLGEQQVQPGEPVGAGDGDDAAVREVHEAACRRRARAARGTGRRSARRPPRRAPPRGRHRAARAADWAVVMPASLRLGSSAARRGAVWHTAEDGEVLHVGLEPEAAPQLARRTAPRPTTSASMHHVAVPADQVHVVVAVGEVVGRRAVPEVGVADQAQLLQQLQRPVDGGDVDAATRSCAPRRGCRPGSRAPRWSTASSTSCRCGVSR